VYEQNDDAERVARSLMAELRIDRRELEGGPTAPGYIIKASILSFLKNCLSALPDQPTLAHLLLGFTCRARELEIAPDSLIAQGTSLFHAIVALAVEYPEVGPVFPDMPYHVVDGANNLVGDHIHCYYLSQSGLFHPFLHTSYRLLEGTGAGNGYSLICIGYHCFGLGICQLRLAFTSSTSHHTG
jgi:hypothetical protein